jgi:hypothetical protein
MPQVVEALFDEFDVDRSGAIDVPELLNFLAYDEPELCVGPGVWFCVLKLHTHEHASTSPPPLP